MKEEILEINGCRSCPFFYINSDYDYYCSKQKKLKELILNIKGNPILYPKWCPLLKKSITIKLT